MSNMEEQNKLIRISPSLSFSWSTLLTIAIIAVRAFQTNAEPMSVWSKMSWVWMTMPIWLTAGICAVIFLFAFIMYIWANVRSY